MKTEKKAYQAPQLKRWGNVAEVTKVGMTKPGGDWRSGSVTPGGAPPFVN